MATTGMDAQSAVKMGPPVLDYGTGIQAAFAIAAALLQRANTGQGQWIDIAMLDAAIMLTGTNITTLQAGGQPPAPNGNDSVNNAGYGCYQTSQGQIMIGAYTAEQRYHAWKVLGDKAQAKRTRKLRVYELAPQVAAERKRMAQILLTASADEWERKFNAAKVPAARVRGIEETIQHAQLQHRGVLQTIKIGDNEVQLPTAAFTYRRHGPRLHSPPPEYGQHTKDILKLAGYTEAEMLTLAEQNIVHGNLGAVSA